ncbi:MAG: adenine phosphoribosyltransferase, partial [Spirochaetales bacterium]|nr:adenine phosphoribosyltransferase [Candidatus Physcosoma equi]
MKKLEEYIRTVPDFPKKGILFRDITAALGDKDGMQLCIDSLAELINDLDVDIIAGTESRGFILGAPLAYRLHKPFLAIRKKGKLPCETIEESYALEYGTATIEIDKSIVKPGDRVNIVDD